MWTTSSRWSRWKGWKSTRSTSGACTSARYEDLEIVANMLRGKRVHPLVRVIVTPASQRIYKKALQNGLIETLIDARLHRHRNGLRGVHWAAWRHSARANAP